ncbi:hypothetical protein [Nocardia nepalensis]|uniref:hypothetical protein n=1 Tax=Nocardia nepalensis TaxID=3375448 RepID=UPI003B67B11E
MPKSAHRRDSAREEPTTFTHAPGAIYTAEFLTQQPSFVQPVGRCWRAGPVCGDVAAELDGHAS